MAELKSGATGGSNLPTDKSGRATLPEGSDVRGNPRKRKIPGEEAGSSDDENPLTDEEEGGTTFSLSEEGDAFIEAAFKSRLDNDSRRKKKKKLGLPDSSRQSSTHLLPPPTRRTLPEPIPLLKEFRGTG